MKQLSKGKTWLRRVVLGGAAMALLITILSLGPVDYAPYLGQE